MADILKRIILSLTAGTSVDVKNVPFRYLHILRSDGEITINNNAGESLGPLAQGMRLDLDEINCKGLFYIQSSVTETVTLLASNRSKIEGHVEGVGGPARRIEGRHVEGDNLGLPNNLALRPVVIGTRNRAGGNNPLKAIDSVQNSPANGIGAGTFYPVVTERVRDDRPDGSVYGPDVSSDLDWVQDFKKWVVTVDFADLADEVAFVAFMGTATACQKPPRIFNRETGLPVAVAGVINGTADGPGEYEVIVEGYSGVTLATPGNADDVTIAGSLVG